MSGFRSSLDPEMVFQENVGQRSVTIRLSDSELAEAAQGSRTISVCTL
jgi:hypothetical protein